MNDAKGCFGVLLALASLGVALLAWLHPFNPVGSSPLSPMNEGLVAASTPASSPKSPTPEPTSTPDLPKPRDPKAEIHRIDSDLFAYENGRKGILIKALISVENLKGIECSIGAPFYFAPGEPLKDFDGDYHTDDGQVAAAHRFIPNTQSMRFEEISFFLPYDELHLAKGQYMLKYRVAIYTYHTDEFLAISDFYSFGLTQY